MTITYTSCSGSTVPAGADNAAALLWTKVPLTLTQGSDPVATAIRWRSSHFSRARSSSRMFGQARIDDSRSARFARSDRATRRRDGLRSGLVAQGQHAVPRVIRTSGSRSSARVCQRAAASRATVEGMRSSSRTCLLASRSSQRFNSACRFWKRWRYNPSISVGPIASRSSKIPVRHGDCNSTSCSPRLTPDSNVILEASVPHYESGVVFLGLPASAI